MTPEDLSTVQSSWTEFLAVRAPLLVALSRQFHAVAPTPIAAEERAGWLFCAVADLVDLLAAPSRLAERARYLGDTWPDPLSAPSFAIDGRAWMQAGGECIAGWSHDVEASWRQAWLLLSDVLAAETLSPFAGGPRLDAEPSAQPAAEEHSSGASSP